MPIFACAGVPGRRFPTWPQEGRAHRSSDGRLSGTRVRDPSRLRAVGRSRDQADAEVAELELLHLGVRAKVLPEAIVDYDTVARRRIIYAGYFRWGCRSNGS